MRRGERANRVDPRPTPRVGSVGAGRGSLRGHRGQGARTSRPQTDRVDYDTRDRACWLLTPSAKGSLGIKPGVSCHLAKSAPSRRHPPRWTAEHPLRKQSVGWHLYGPGVPPRADWRGGRKRRRRLARRGAAVYDHSSGGALAKIAGPAALDGAPPASLECPEHPPLSIADACQASKGCAPVTLESIEGVHR